MIRRPTRIVWTDSCPFGPGGVDLSGRAWQIRIPKLSPLWGLNGINNVLEFLAMLIGIWLTLLQLGPDGEECILALGDDMSAIGWIFRAGCMPKDSPFFEVVTYP